MRFSKFACLALALPTSHAFVAQQKKSVAFSSSVTELNLASTVAESISNSTDVDATALASMPSRFSKNSASSSEVAPPTVASVPKLAQRWRKSTKQLATLGPASSSFEMIEKLFLAGADVFRLNFSHGAQEQKKDLLDTIRQIEEKYSHPIAVLGDLQGPKLRVGEFSESVSLFTFHDEYETFYLHIYFKTGVMLEAGQSFRLDLDSSK